MTARILSPRLPTGSLKVNEGVLIWYNIERGFGLIAEGNFGHPVFFHWSDYSKQKRTADLGLTPGVRLSFDLYQSPKDPKRYIAKNVKLAY